MKTYATNSFFKFLSIVLLVTMGLSTTYSQIRVSLPAAAGPPATNVRIPVNVSTIAVTDSITAIEFEVLCDSTVLRLTGIDASGTVLEGLGASANYFRSPFGPGRMKVSCASATPITGSGVLIYLTGTPQVTTGSTTLTLSNLFFFHNSDVVSTVITNGSYRIDRAPTMNSVSPKTAAEGDTLRFTATATDPDLPNDTLKFSMIGPPTGATLSALTGAFQWSPAYGQAGSYTFWIKVTDLAGASDSTSVSITVTHTNRPPSFVTKLRDTTINQGATLVFTFGAVDPDAGTTLTYSLSNPPSGASISTSGVLTFAPPSNPARTYSIVAVVSDGFLRDTAKATVTVNRKPVLNSRLPNSLTLVSQNKSQTFSVSVTDPDGGAVTFTWKVNGVTDKTGPDSTYSKSFSDPNNTPKTVACVFTDATGLKDSTSWSFTITGIFGDQSAVPTEFALGQNYPNPFNPTTTIRFDLPKEAPVMIEIYNILGVRVRTLLNGESMNAGRHAVAWDGRDESGIDLPSGVYLYRINAADFRASKKMTMLK